MTVKPGQSLGQYHVIEQIGKGGMATVFRATQPSLSREVAIKVLPDFFADDPAFHARFRQEAMAIAKLRHPNILTVFDSGEADGVAYIVTELVEGGTLADKLGKPLPLDYCVTIATGVAAALDYAHARGMIHRDVKPSNVLLGVDGTPILSDFGLARMTISEAGGPARLTATGTALGTPEYMAPEQVASSAVGPPADVYALAVTLYEMLTGTVPYTADTPVHVIVKRMSEPLPLPRTRNPDLSEAVQNVLLKGLAQDPTGRYQTAGEMARALRRAPAFTAVVVLTLGLGLGATTAIFSAVDALILRPLPYREPERLMHVSLTTPDLPTRKGTDDGVWSYPKFLVFRQTQTVFEDLALYSEAQFNIAMGSAGEAERVRGEWITRGYLPTLGLSVERGRNFSAADDHPDAPREAIISDALWQRRFNANPSTIGRVIDVNREPFTIIGVMPPGFSGLWGNGDLFLPIAALSASALGQPASHSYEMVARRKSDVAETQARNAVTIPGAQIDRMFPDKRFTKGMGAAARPLDDARVAPQVKRSVVVLFGAVAFVLLIACVNVANLLVGRAESRRREIAIRLAIGAGRGRLVRLLLIESLLLAISGGVLGALVAWLGVHALAAANPAAVQMRAGIVGLGIIGLDSIHLDMQALVFALGLTLSVGLVFGLAPAIGATSPSLTDALKNAFGKNGARHRQARWLLVVAEVALSVVLLAGSGLMIRSLTKLVEIDPGFDGTNVLTARLALPGGAIKRDSLPSFYAQFLDRVSALPGVTAASLGDSPPLAGTNSYTKINLIDSPAADFSLMPSVSVAWATASWFDVLRVPLKRGRMFASTDRAGAPSVVLVSEAGARKFWPSENPIGKRVAIGMGGFDEAHGGAEVIGVVGDVHTRLDSLPGPTLYLPYAQSPQSRIILFIRTAAEPTSLTAPLRAASHDLAPAYPLYDVQTMAARTATATASARFSSGLLGLFSIIALALAAVGIYGVMAMLVGQRTKEIGIRMAVGADARTIVAMVVGQGLRVAAIGTTIGLVGAVVLTRFLRTLLFEVSTTDPAAYVLATLVFGAAAALASWIPARRAARVDPLETLRTE